MHALLETSFEVLGPSISMAFFKKVFDLIEKRCRSVYLGSLIYARLITNFGKFVFRRLCDFLYDGFRLQGKTVKTFKKCK